MSKNIIYKTQELNILKINQDKGFKEEKIHKYFEEHLNEIVGADKIDSEYRITVTVANARETEGRIDTLAIDSDNRPVIIEYKRDKIEDALIQSLFYKNWLKTNKRQFYLEVKDIFDKRADNINWNIRVILVAQEFDKWTLAATKFIPGLELFRFSFYGGFKYFNLEYIKDTKEKKISNNNENIIQNKTKFIEIMDAHTNKPVDYESAIDVINKFGNKGITNLKRYETLSPQLQKIFHKVTEYMHSLDEYVELVKNKDYWVWKTSKTFAEVIFRRKKILIQLDLDKMSEDNPKYKWMGDKGHWGTLKSCFEIESKNDFDAIQQYIKESFNRVNSN
ncbi:DUF5655 domain-containing protein [Candidatus Mycoplasma mahonii]|uniref:DUF5655 domain-containing protein n=1 Tax=Candidatus Mycoplasma mahonii TaxID=3004105 RepID=UPI0026EC5B81|nr:DUF5655 domain-containing protein [Candidatus Mycoplasma mahonii]WKX02269.1 hypothetical protein O3I44_02595 [Candidatus Mycoplasma mahonii]